MNNNKLVPYFPSGVCLKKNNIYDETLDTSLPINNTAKMMLMEIDGDKEINEIIQNLNTKFKVDEDILFKDISTLFGNLNRNYLLNWRVKTNSKIKDLIINFLSQYKRSYKERFEIHNFDFFSIFLKILMVVLRKIIIFWIAVVVLSIVAYIYAQMEFIISLIYYFSVVYAGLILSFALHETMHAYMHRKMTNKYPGFIASDVMSVKFIRPVIMPYQKKMIWITLLGPLTPGIIGIIGILLTQVFGASGSLAYTLNVIFTMFAVHMFYLLPFLGDGKSIVGQFMLNKLGG
ncbi:metallopeptidase [Viridibacillus arvi]|uniref:metallopeptidase n=1 Tax=Viridibacillus arvi TaxID=263475 RepID=UPI003D07F156